MTSDGPSRREGKRRRGAEATPARQVGGRREQRRRAAETVLVAGAEHRLAPLWFAATALLAWSFGFTRMLNSDLWFHLAAGRMIVEQRGIPRVDSWSYTAAGQPWHNHEWLSGVVLYAWSQWFGKESLVFWHWALLVAAALVLFDLMRQWTSPAHALVILVFALGTAAPFFDIRPTAWSLLFFALLLRLTLAARPRPRLVPLLFVPWSNLHGGFVFGLMALALIVAAHLLPLRRRSLGRWPRPAEGLVILTASVAASLLNPFGWHALLYPLRLAWEGDSPSRTSLVEWLSPFRPGGIESPLYVPCLALALAAAVVLTIRGLRRSEPRLLAIVALTLLTAAMSLTSRRFIVLFAVAAALAFAHVMPGREWVRGRLALAGVALALAFGIARLWPYPLGPAAFNQLNVVERMPEDEIGFALENGLAGRLFCYFQWAGYVQWRAGDALPVFIDPRSETVYTPAIQRRYLRIVDQVPGWQQMVAASGADYVLWPFAPQRQRTLVLGLLATGRWRVVHTGAQGVLLGRGDLELPPLRPSPSSPWRSWGLARSALGDGDLAGAERHLVQAAEQPPALVGVCRELAVVQRRLGKHEHAVETDARCAQIFPG